MHNDSSSRAKRIGSAVLRVLAERALELIPIYGPYISVTMDVINAAKEEIEREQYITREQLEEALHSLSYTETKTTIDAVLASSTGKAATAQLNADQRDSVRKQLIALPSEVDRLLEEIQRREQEQERIAETEEARRRQERYATLREQLKSHLTNGELIQAHRAAQQILRISPRDQEARKAEQFLYRRLITKRDNPLGCLAPVVFSFSLLLGLLYMGFMGFFASLDGSATAKDILLVVVLFLGLSVPGHFLMPYARIMSALYYIAAWLSILVWSFRFDCSEDGGGIWGRHLLEVEGRLRFHVPSKKLPTQAGLLGS